MYLMDRAALFIGRVTIYPETANSIKKYQCKLPPELELGDSQQCGCNNDNESEEKTIIRWLLYLLQRQGMKFTKLREHSCSHLQCLLGREEAGYSTSCLRRMLTLLSLPCFLFLPLFMPLIFASSSNSVYSYIFCIVRSIFLTNIFLNGLVKI